MKPGLILLAMMGVLASFLWYGNTLTLRKYKVTISAGFASSVAQWLLFLAIGFTPIRSLFYTAILFVFMCLMWFAIEFAQNCNKAKDWQPSTSFWVYFLGGMASCIGICQCII